MTEIWKDHLWVALIFIFAIWPIIGFFAYVGFKNRNHNDRKLILKGLREVIVFYIILLGWPILLFTVMATHYQFRNKIVYFWSKQRFKLW